MPKRKADDGSNPHPVEGSRFRGEFTRLEREYALARSILAARTASGMSKKDFAKAVGTSKGKLGRWERAEAIPRLEALQRIANATGLSFQIGIEPLEDPNASNTRTGSPKASAGRKSTARKSTGRKSSARKSTARKSTGRKSSARKRPTRRTTTRKSSARKGAARKSTGRKSSSARKPSGRKAAASRRSVRKTTTRKSSARRGQS